MALSTDLSGRRALVTGAGRHTGREFALALAACGAEVAVNDIVADKAEAVCDEIRTAGGTARALPFDVTDHAAVTEAVGGFAPDILVNNTGGTDAIAWPPTTFDQTDPSSWAHFVDVNFYGVLNCCHAAIPAMRERGWGRIITMVSDSARRGEPGLAVYAGAKAAAAGFMRCLAAELGREGITCNCVALGTLAYAHHGDVPEETARKMLRSYSVKRLGRPTDPVGMILLLASDAGEWISGQVLPVNGGYTNAL
ncbi:MAG: SDR family oxidoreductase [Acidimicrobiales bacterium]|nr:SDR family oxidoreductase [Acidimicrobiales bacterium]